MVVLAAAVVLLLVVLAFAVVVGAWAANSSSRVLMVVALEVVLVPVLLDEPFELTLPAIMMAPPVTLIDPVEPPVEESAPLTVTA